MGDILLFRGKYMSKHLAEKVMVRSAEQVFRNIFGDPVGDLDRLLIDPIRAEHRRLEAKARQKGWEDV